MSVNRRQPERCYCGDPECKNCFPFTVPNLDEDEEDEEIDDA